MWAFFLRKRLLLTALLVVVVLAAGIGIFELIAYIRKPASSIKETATYVTPDPQVTPISRPDGGTSVVGDTFVLGTAKGGYVRLAQLLAPPTDKNVARVVIGGLSATPGDSLMIEINQLKSAAFPDTGQIMFKGTAIIQADGTAFIDQGSAFSSGNLSWPIAFDSTKQYSLVVFAPVNQADTATLRMQTADPGAVLFGTYVGENEHVPLKDSEKAVWEIVEGKMIKISYE